jgi:ABC-type multidrug transport system fused ATPase/permease subunit
MVLLFKLFGISFLWSFFTFIFLISLAWAIEYFYIKTKRELLLNNDDRIKNTSSILQNIKEIKMYTFESLFYNILKRKRAKEMKNYKRIENIFVLSDFIHWLIPLFLSVVSVGVEIFTKENISIENIIVAIEIYDSFAYPLYRIPVFISSLLNTLLSMERIQIFLNEENIDEIRGKFNLEQEPEQLETYVKYRDDDQYSIIIEKTNFGIRGKTKEEDQILLRDINLKIKKGSIVGILGETGSGKTNLAYGILRHFSIIKNNHEEVEQSSPKNDDYLYVNNSNNNNSQIYRDINNDINNHINNDDLKNGELIKSFSSEEEEIKLKKNNSNLETRSAQRMVVNGSISYACQIPFVINDTVKNNITFFNKDNNSKFWKVIEVCQLTDDLRLFPANEYSEISPGGANISGGQKARICLARAVYNDADIYILDDPISSVDPIVYNKIYKNLLLDYLKDKTRIILQNDQNFIEHMEYIYFINQGKIVFSGTYEEFIKTEWYKKMISKETTNLQKVLGDNMENVARNKIRKKSTRKLSIEGDKGAFIEKGKVVNEESIQKGGIKFTLFKKLFYIMGNKSYILPLFVFIFSLSWQGLQVISNHWLTLWTKKVVNKKFDDSQNTKTQLSQAIIYYYVIYCLIKRSVS